jgi:glycosyltransferase involved in cell wall biosynthesis
MRIVMDQRPALRARTGVGEYIHQTAKALAREFPDDSLTLFTSSWKDRPSPAMATSSRRVHISDHRIPVCALNFMWHRLEWPPIELVTQRRYDVTFSPHPLMMPSRKAASVVMIHDLDFLRHPERTHREIRRDYPRLARQHARRAGRLIVPSKYTAADVVQQFGVPPNRIAVCPPGAPEWREPVRPRLATDGYILFMGTLEQRKNIGGLLDAYRLLRARRHNAPKLVLAGTAGADAQLWLDAIGRPPLAGHVEYVGYLPDHERQRVYAGARLLVLPSYDEGFGMPALEAMSLGIPVVGTNRGAVPELIGDAGLLIDPGDVESIVTALDRLLTDDDLAQALGWRGLERSQGFRWADTARAVHVAFQHAVEEHRQRANARRRHVVLAP